jgi:phospho-N-acetylmuramoyl-pentapeptide-transferase
MTIAALTDGLTMTLLLGGVAFVTSMLLTPVYTHFAYRYKFWKKQRTSSTTGEALKVFNKLHAEKFKRNIPTMAGGIIVLAVLIVTVYFNLDRSQTWLPLAALLGGGLVGLLDDIINIRGDGSGVAGMRSSVKFLMITLVGVALGWYFSVKLGYDVIHVLFAGDWIVGAWMVPLFAFAVVATSNAVNISDGLDGLAGGLSAFAFSAFGIIALLQGHFLLAGFCFTVVGGLLSYLWFNIYPARFFMGDVGSFALGTSLGVVAMMTNTVFLLPVIGIVFVLEAGSSVVQILSKKIRHKKIFLSAPVHHHLEASGWPETKVTMRFWLIGAIAAICGVLLAVTGGHI